MLNEVLIAIYPSSVAGFLFGLLDTIRIDSRATPRFLLRHPLRYVSLGFPFQVVAQLVVQFLVRLRPAKQRPQPQWNRVKPMLGSHSPTSFTRTSERPSDRRAWPDALARSTPPIQPPPQSPQPPQTSKHR